MKTYIEGFPCGPVLGCGRLLCCGSFNRRGVDGGGAVFTITVPPIHRFLSHLAFLRRRLSTTLDFPPLNSLSAV